MSIEFLDELENKIDGLIANLNRMKDENVKLSQKLDHVNGRIGDMETENRNLKSELESLKTDSQGRQDKLNAAAERIKSLISKLETVQQ